MKLAFDKLNQHQIIIQKRNKTSYRYVHTSQNLAQTLRFICFLHIREDGVEDELWIKLNKYLLALFCNVSIP